MKNNIIISLVHVLNLCIDKSIWPDSLKMQKSFRSTKMVINITCQTISRPISLISNIAKIYEKIIYNRLYDFISKNNIIFKLQFGFMKNRGISDALNFFCNLVYNNLDKGKPVIATFLDLAKAFYTVNHEILLTKLYRYGIRGSAYRLLASYLSNRKQKVRIKNHNSNYQNIISGVTQGRILGPLLFILYINDLLTDMDTETIISYADDTVIISSYNNWTAAQNKLNLYLDKVAHNKLSLNLGKTVYTTFGNYRDSVPDSLNVIIDNITIKRVNYEKYLGVFLDYNMKWDIHIQYILNKTKYLSFAFSRLAKIMQPKTLLLIYYAFFNSIISYGIIA